MDGVENLVQGDGGIGGGVLQSAVWALMLG